MDTDYIQRAIDAYNNREQEAKDAAVQALKSLRMALMVKVRTILDSPVQFINEADIREVGNRLYLQSRDPRIEKLTFTFDDPTKQTLAIYVKCADCYDEMLIPVKTIADVGALMVNGYPKHENCSKQHEGRIIDEHFEQEPDDEKHYE